MKQQLQQQQQQQLQKHSQSQLRLIAVSSVLGLLLSACGTNPAQQAQSNQQDEYRAQSKVAKQAISEAPAWMYKLPKEAGVIYENGTAISSDFSMADLKAKTMAYVKICTGAGGKVRSQMKMYRADNDAASVEQSELTVRSLCPDVDISGVETVEMKHVAEGNRIRTYVLVALPMGQKNAVKSGKEIQNRSGEAFKELDNVTKDQAKDQNKDQTREQAKEQSAPALVAPAQTMPPIAPSTNLRPEPAAIPPLSQSGSSVEKALVPPEAPTLKMNVRPATKMDGSMMDSVRAVGPDTVIVESADGTQKQLGLLGSRNPEYIAKRAEALNKPGAVIGQVSIE
ncbi:hypothetical protein [Polynucleobacter antarcticus]|uniref:Uncharacterized protein n=1 Tax=Polynucleobacter antarcticus TaxID=1743162 RepID=A0A6M9PXV8_9BURK|nr:hypothetical protein [Polynucleobacter antarcticus]QKM62706.1 hypothetical protein DCO16_06330 [Polynucleobacter antarcticus]